ncbi:MAG: membrane-bound PQQ-dependent dehydrogenase, glucose/quinate/shikimate family [Rhodovulum sulfidophilum]|uniref:Membrane-bound PQQ-dependent dehydrogenase, glucose/quinate/shikimate family n=1 Tax=Rhodovulum sulfidophilum TaxID=35806 RepID=A0A2W5QFC9_RHOSU|nr:MAG: membrane-bound PQQ-dependent dehydrogenase, glucose/quinate/shikimate family [Rhodovulum sulfidophilum]
MSEPNAGTGLRWLVSAYGAILAIVGLVLGGGGLWLAALGGSWYYLIAGAALVVAGVLMSRRAPAGFALFAAVALLTVPWALWETGGAFWGLVPRLAPWLVMGIVAALLWPLVGGARTRIPAFAVAGLLLLVGIAGGVAMFRPHGVIRPAKVTHAAIPANPGAPARWEYYGYAPGGTRFVPYTAINRDNVVDLEVAWTFRTGEAPVKGTEFQNTPIQIGDSVYVCTPLNQVIALDADTGAEKWRFDPEVEPNQFWNRCRGVGYYESRLVPEGAACHARVVLTTNDARMIALDAATGAPCEAFGARGEANLEDGLGEVKPSYYMPTSMPTVIEDLVIVGGWVFDGREVGEPSGVIRAYSAENGELVWAWDLGDPEITKLPPEGETYTRGTPNMWSTPAFDPELGLIYLPLGNSTPDFWGGHRSEASKEYGASIVALDYRTGREKWHFQTTHYDVWDYDVPAQPALVDIPDGAGGVIPAVAQVTKTGFTYVLDRRTGAPVKEVVETPVSQDGEEGAALSPTQPFSTGMPHLGGDRLTEADMWGATMFDQLACRVAFRQLRYDGPFTPLSSEDMALIYPGFYGGMNWGSVAIDENLGYMIVNDIRMPQQATFIRREDVTAEMAASLSHDAGVHPQNGTPWAALRGGFYSPLGIPCHAPPWGTVSAVDLKTGELVWQRPAGSIEDATLSNGLKLPLPMEIGMPTLGGPLSTAGGITFFAGTQDYYLRAYDTATGDELWKGRLPVGGQATPMSYVSPNTGEQYVVVAAGGARQSPDRGDYVVAYKLRR